MALPVYFTGTVSVAAGGTVVTGAGVMWSGINAKQGDFISINNLAEVLITEVTDATHLKIAPWPGAAQTGAAYVIYQNYVGRVVGVAAAEDVGVMLEKLHVDGLPFILGAEETVPDPSYGDEGQLAFKPSTGQWWEKSGGVWVISFGLTALGYGGTSATPLLIGTGTKTFTTQGSLAYDGARVRAASAANANNWMEGIADYSGTTLTMTSDKIGGSGTHADWLFSIAGHPGVDGTGAGDMLAANNLSELTATAATARKNIYAAPFDALAYNGMQINGSMEVSQERGGAGLALPGTGTFHAIDGWEVTKSGAPSTSNLTIFQNASTIPGYARSLNMTVTTAQASLSTHTIDIIQQIEGWRVARLGWGTASAVPLTIGFWVKSSVTGSLPVYILQSPFPTVTVTITTASVPQWVTLTIPAQTGGTWNGNDGLGFKLAFRIASAGAMNIVSSTSNTFEITGVVVLPGIEAPSAERSPLIMRPYDQELLTCKRYYEKATVSIYNYAAAITNTTMMLVPYAEKRATPTVTLINAPTTVNAVSLAVYDIFPYNCMFGANASANAVIVQVRGALLSIDARL